jgi:geranylgeranyl diphosphate synthase type II
MTTASPPLPLEDYLAELRDLVDASLRRALPSTTAPPLIVEAMDYSLMGGGKRLRPCLTLAVADDLAPHFGVSRDVALALALPAACAVEMIHTYSLVHDDLPAMDDDALRRGRPTTHVVYGDGLAVLVGDGLLTEAFAVLSRIPSPAVPEGLPDLPIERRLQAIGILAFAAGAVGMVGGQTIDLAASGKIQTELPPALDAPALEDMHARKTGALIRAAGVLGAVCLGAAPPQVAAIDVYARELGLAFQIVDDLLDVEGTEEELGKPAGRDAQSGKLTYPRVHGVEKSREIAHQCVARARDALDAAGLGGRLAELADWTVRRHS